MGTSPKIKISYYPISLEEIELKVLKKNGRKENYRQTAPLFPLQNVKRITNEFEEEIVRVDGTIPPDLSVKDNDRFLFISYDQTKFTHGLHKYPAKFFPELPRWIIERYSRPGDFVLDPFAGSGTTNVEASLLGRNSVGIDVDPFSRFLAKVKTTPLQIDELRIAQNEVITEILNYRPDKISNRDIPDFPYRDNWFNREIIFELSYIKKVIDEISFSASIKNFFKVCFSSIIRSVSNADDNCTRTVIRKRLNKKVYPADALIKFVERVLLNVPKMAEYSRLRKKGICVELPENMDARSINYKDKSFDLAVTSPPYANAVDYPRTHQLELYWLGLAKGSLVPLKKRHVGTENVSANDYKTLHKLGIKKADEVIEKIFRKDKRRSFIVFRYLQDMKKNLEETFRVLRKGGRYVIVVGNNRVRGEVVENWKYFVEFASKTGFRVENYFASEIIRHFIKVPREERINTDWILVLRK